LTIRRPVDEAIEPAFRRRSITVFDIEIDLHCALFAVAGLLETAAPQFVLQNDVGARTSQTRTC
jgi:hypothetical protein